LEKYNYCKRGGKKIATTEVWIITILGILSALVAGHLIITKILPKIKTAMDLAVKDNVAAEGLIMIFFIYIGLFVVRKVLELIIATNENWAKYLGAIKPGIDVLTDLLPYLGVFMIAVMIAVAIRKK
jgi:hypothetical protein